MSRERWLAAVVLAAALLPVAVFHRTARAPATHLVAALPSASPLDDPTTNATAMARAWARWERGDLSTVDDRVFAPVPNALASGEWLPLSSLVGYPFHAWSGTVPAGVNAAYFFAVFSFPVLLYAFYARLGGPGFTAAAAAFVVAYGPGRMNTLGVLAGLSTAFVLLAVIAACDWLRKGGTGNLLLFGVALVAQGLFSLYGIALGLLFAVPATAIVCRRDCLRAARALSLAGAGLAAFFLLRLAYGPYFRIAEDLGVTTGMNSFESHSADLLSLLHGGIFGGPVRAALEKLVPGFPPGAAAFFPTLAFSFALLVWATVARRRSRAPLPWLLLASALFLCALGPTIHAAGRAIAPGPYRVVTMLPVFSSLRGIDRFDQWFDVALGAAAVLAVGALPHPARTRVAAAFGALAALDAWPADIPSFRFPEVSSYARRLDELPRDASVAVYPWNRFSSTQAWVDQIAHGKRVVNGWFSFPPASHFWAERAMSSLPVAGGFALLRQLGASVIVADRGRLSPAAAAELDALAVGTGGVRRVEETPGFRLYWLDALEPCLVDSAAPPPLRFRGQAAAVECRPGHLVFRLGVENRPVLIRSGGGVTRGSVRFPVAGPSPMRVSLSPPSPPGATVEDASTGRVIGRVEPPGP